MRIAAPDRFEGEALAAEISAALGVEVEVVFLPSSGELEISGTDDRDAVTATIDAHNPPVQDGPPPSADERIAALEDEVRGMRDRVASVEAISDEVRAMRDAIAPGRKD